MLTGLRFPDIDDLLKWINNLPDVWPEIEEIIQLLEHLDFRHINNIVKAFEKIFALVVEILNELKPWAN